MLTTIIRDHKIIVGEKEDKKEIYLTRQQYMILEQDFLDKSGQSPFSIKDPETWKKLYTGRLWDIKDWCGENKTSSSAWKRYVCDFWTRHPLNEECECRKKYGIDGCVFKEKMRNFGIMYTADVNDTNRSKILAL